MALTPLKVGGENLFNPAMELFTPQFTESKVAKKYTRFLELPESETTSSDIGVSEYEELKGRKRKDLWDLQREAPTQLSDFVENKASRGATDSKGSRSKSSVSREEIALNVTNDDVRIVPSEFFSHQVFPSCYPLLPSFHPLLPTHLLLKLNLIRLPR
jgi:hypothetical protein